VWEAVNERIIMVRLGCRPINISLIAVYAPINPSKGQKADMDVSDNFYINLQETVDKVPKGDMLLIVGDFNARVGKEVNQGPGNVVGPHTVDSINENGKRMIDFCNLNSLIVTNTFFQHKTDASNIMDASRKKGMAHVRLCISQQEISIKCRGCESAQNSGWCDWDRPSSSTGQS